MSRSNGYEGGGAVKDLAGALAMIERAFGKGSVMSLGEGPLAEVEAISTGALSLDLALGIGGCPGGGSSRSTGRSPLARRRSPTT